MVLSIAIAVVGVVVVGITRRLIDLEPLRFLASVCDLIMTLEIVVFGIVAVETASRAIRTRFASQVLSEGIIRRSVVFRAVLRTVAYGALGVAAVSVLAKSPAPAVSVGSLTGVFIGLAAQSTIGNAFAGMVIAIARSFTLGDEVTVMSAIGKIVEIGAMFTRLDPGDSWLLIPNDVLLSQAI